MVTPDITADVNGFIYDFNARKGTQRTRHSQIFSAVLPSHYPQSLMLSDRATALSTRSINTSTNSRSTLMSSCFDRPRTQTASSIFTAPPLHGPAPQHRNRPVLPSASPLVCEFIGFVGCNAIFDPEDEAGWIGHIAHHHLNNTFPMVCICWFCGNVPAFTAASNSQADREACYRRRMHHIAWHFRNGWSGSQMRPDFFFLDHVHENGLITEEVFQQAKRYHEVPQIPNLYPSGWRPEHQGAGARFSVEVEVSRPRRGRSAHSHASQIYHS
ncbi:hypothetical protein FZEAL_6796 [Fusarium zealandicum]|uniref:Uncharacterized protein n=1 Tax=Fusarium zealandicum TaxID=1053134 RepID=A0A8H4UHT9_9HYPO|nr:hypothetical protein FZEAL_6796 [Fusarium zealandicum]